MRLQPCCSLSLLTQADDVIHVLAQTDATNERRWFANGMPER